MIVKEESVNKYKTVRVLQGNYGYGWDDLCEYPNDSSSAKERKNDLKSYQENEPGVPFRFITRRVLNKEDIAKEGKKMNIKEATNYGWTVEDSKAWDAYDFACEYFGEDYVDNAIVHTLSNEELASSLAFLFRMWDFRQYYDEYIDELDESKNKSLTEVDKGYTSKVQSILDELYVEDNKIITNYLTDNVDLYLFNTEKLYNEIKNKRRKSYSIAYEAMLELFQINVDDYLDGNKIRVTSDMIKRWFTKYNVDFKDILKPIVEKIDEERTDLF